MSLTAIQAGNVAVITGGGAGIGLAVARRLAERGMALVIVDIQDALLAEVETTLLQSGAPQVMTSATDVSDRAAVQDLKASVQSRFGRCDLLMCNAGIQSDGDIFDTNQTWSRVLGVNFGGVVNMCQIFVPPMIAAGTPGLVINTGSKQGITTPPGNPAYNISKAALRVFTEALQHHLREQNSAVSAHLLIPGFVFTGLTSRGRAEKPAGAWTPEQTADFMFDRLEQGDFYILCPDNDVTREMDEKRMIWAMGDIVENRPPLSRWHPDWANRFDAFLEG
jgi:NAD(P)-dependent dehydrogenase (short-subunit alcohol dehydrogenase family)